MTAALLLDVDDGEVIASDSLFGSDADTATLLDGRLRFFFVSDFVLSLGFDVGKRSGGLLCGSSFA